MARDQRANKIPLNGIAIEFGAILAVELIFCDVSQPTIVFNSFKLEEVFH